MLGMLRRRLRIGIGGMMLAILLLGLWLGDRVNRAREQRTAVAAVKADNGFVLYADEFNMGPVNVPAGNAIWKPSWGTLIPKKGQTKPSLLRRWLGDEYVREVVHVSLFVDIEKGSAGAPNNLPRPLDDVLAALRSQSGIKTLHLGGETITDKGLASVAELTDLRELVIWWATDITDAGVAHFSFLPKLRLVNISLSSLTDEGVRHLSQLPALEDLHLQGKKFSDQSLLHLSRAKRLKSLYLIMDVSEISDEGIKHLEGLSNLRRLHLSQSNLSNEAKERLLKAIPGLEILP
jgi:Leucine-rich repeat (LRR) protein